MDWINYHHLYYFWIIAKEGSVTRAAKRLNLAQPTLSGQLKQFEDFVKKPVFDRKARGLALNENGRMLFNYADTIFHLGQQMMDSMHRPKQRAPITLRVGIDPHLPKKIVHKYLRRAMVADFLLHTDMDRPERLLDKLMARNLDFLVCDGKPAHLSSTFTAVELEHSHYVLAAAPEWKSLKKNFPASLQDKPILLPGRPELQADFENCIKEWKVRPTITGLIDDPELLRIAALASEAAVVIPRSAISDLIKSKELVVLGEDLPLTHTLYLVTTEHKSPQTQDFLNNLQK